MYRIVTFCDATFQMLPFHIWVPPRGPTTPAMRCHNTGLGSSPVARHYWGNHCYFLFLEVLRCFSSLRSPPDLTQDNSPSDYWVVPFGNPRIKGHLHLPQAYRSLSRPSSPPWAKASAMRPFLLSPMILKMRYWDNEEMRHLFSFSTSLILYISIIAHTFSCWFI